jgi:hypothetical protein
LFYYAKPRNAIVKFKKIEVIAIGLVNLTTSEIQTNKTIALNIRNLLFYVHQNFLILIQFVLTRMSLPYLENVSKLIKS